MLLGDFNFHWNDVSSSDMKSVHSILETFSLQKPIADATHINGNTLDWVIAKLDTFIVSASVSTSLISDHHAVHCHLNFAKPAISRAKVSFRRHKDIDTT